MKKKLTLSLKSTKLKNLPQIHTSNLNLSINNTYVLIRNNTQENLSFSQKGNLPNIYNNNFKKNKDIFSPIKLTHTRTTKIKNTPNIHTIVLKQNNTLKSEYENNPLFELMTSNKILSKFLYFFNIRELLILMNINKKINIFIKNSEVFKKYIIIKNDLKKGKLFKDLNKDKIFTNNRNNIIMNNSKSIKYKIKTQWNQYNVNNNNFFNINSFLKYNLLNKSKIKLTKVINPKIFNLEDSSFSNNTQNKEKTISNIKLGVFTNSQIDSSRNSFFSIKTGSSKNKSQNKEKISKINDSELINVNDINFDKLKMKLLSLIRNNGHKISLLIKKYKLNYTEFKLIFNGIIEFYILKILKSNQILLDSLIIQNINTGKFIELYLDPILNMNFLTIKKINFNNAILSSSNIIKKISILISRNINNIKILSLQNNNINDILAKILFNSLKQNKTLSILNLDHNQISIQGITFMRQFIKNNESLNTLVLSYNYLSTSGSNLLISYLKEKNNSNLRILDLSYNGIGEGGIKSLADYIKINGKLVSLFFNGNYLCDNGLNLFSKLLFNNQEDRRVKISYLDINNNSLTKNSFKYINNIIYFSSFITSINISYNNFDNEGVCNIFKCLNSKSKLVSLDISKTNINEKSIEFMSKKIDKSIALRILNLSYNNLSRACKYLKNLLLKETNLKIVKLSYCNISQDSNLILEGLSENNSLQTFDISNNFININDLLLNTFKDFFKNNNILNNLYMDNINIDDIGMYYISQFLELNHGLKIISFKNNKITNKSALTLINSLQKNENIRKISLIGNQIEPYILKQIDKLLNGKTYINKNEG